MFQNVVRCIFSQDAKTKMSLWILIFHENQTIHMH